MSYFDNMFILILPDLFFLFKNGNLYYFSLSILFFIYVFSIIKTTKYIFILLPFFILVPSYLYYIYIYHVPISEQVLTIVLETNFIEAWEFIGHKIYWYIFNSILWFVFCCYIVFRHYKNPLVWRHHSRLGFFVIGTLFFLTLYNINRLCCIKVFLKSSSAI